MPQPRRIFIDRPEPPCPHSPAQLRRIVQDAVDFIRRRQHDHTRMFGVEVGEHLFTELYCGDEAYVRRIDPTKIDSPADISRETGIPYSTLYLYLVAAMVKHKLERAGVKPELGLKHLASLDVISDHLDAMRALALWAQQERISYRRLGATADAWEEHLAQGGRLEDLLADPRKGEPVVVKVRERRVEARYLRARRMLVVVGRWWAASKLSTGHRRALAEKLIGIRKLLVGASS